MLSTLIDVGKDGNVFLNDNALVQAPKMWEVYKHKDLGSNMVRYIVWMYDYNSVYRNTPLEQRDRRVKRAIWGKNPSKRTKMKLVQEAIEEYKSYQYDPDIASYQVMLEKADEINKVLAKIPVTSDNIEEINVIQEKIYKAAKSRKELLELIKKTTESDKKFRGKDGANFSVLEQRLRDQDK